MNTMPRSGLGTELATDECWNHNTHYHRLIPRYATPPYRSVLDFGCGEGLLTRRLAAHAGRVTGVDVSPEMIARARTLATSPIDYVCGDGLTVELGGPFDLVTCFATLHHMDLQAGLRRLGELTAPGGTLLVVGLADPASALDWVVSAAGVPANRWARRRRGGWDPGAPIRDTTHTYGQVRRAARQVVPGARLRRRLYWRYSLVWRAPEALTDAR